VDVDATTAALREIVERLTDGIVLVDRQARCRYANPGAARILGRAAPDLIGKPLRETAPDPVGAALDAAFSRLVAGEEVMLLRSFFAQERWYEALARPMGEQILVLLRDITERLQAESARRQSEERFRLIVNGVRDYAIFMLDLKAQVASWNSGAERLYGYRADEIMRKHVSIFFPPEDVERGVPRNTVEAAAKHGSVEGEGWRLRRDRSRFLVNFEYSTLYDDLGEPSGFAVVTRDVTERRRRDDERQLLVSLLENSHDFIGLADPSGKPIWVNVAGLRMVGLPPDYPVEQTRITEYYAPDEREFAVDEILKSTVERGRWRGETYFRNWQTGEAIPVSTEQFMIRDASGTRVLGIGTITRDISEARRISDQLRQSEERFRLTIDEAPIGMALVELDGRFARVNRRLCEIVGYTASELEQLKFQDITHPADVGRDVALAKRLASGEIPRIELEKRYIRKDGEIVTILLSSSVLRAGDGTPLYFIAQLEDITERKRAERALLFSEARFSGIVSISADAIISVDENQRITLFNQGAEAIFGYSSAEAIGAPLDILIPERLREAHRQHVARFAAGDVPARRMGERITSILGRRKTGEEFPAEAAISKLAVDGSTILTVALRDVTDRKRIEKQHKLLADAADLLSGSLDYEQNFAAVGQLVVREFADWCIVDVVERDERPRRLRVLCADPSQASLCAQLEQLPLDRRQPHLVRPPIDTKRPFLIERVTAEDVESFAQSAEHLRLLRALEPRSLMGVPLLIRGELFGVLVFISSTSSRRYGPADLAFGEALAARAALAIQNGRLYQQAVHATQLRDEVLGVVAHDLRNPLFAIRMQSKLSQRRAPEAERRNQKPNEMIQRSADRMNHLIQDLLDFSAIESGQLGIERSRVSPREVLMECLEVQRPLAATASVSLEARLDQGGALPDVWGDQQRLLQALENLIGNATKFTPPGGQVTIGAAPREGEVLFWVADTGCGISPEGLEHVFDRFWQAKRGGGKGAGLGLSITRGIVQAHGGRIWVESTPGRGTTFFFTVPQAPHAEALRPQAPQP
jgi:PAS domain S-box-containing protein